MKLFFGCSDSRPTRYDHDGDASPGARLYIERIGTQSDSFLIRRPYCSFSPFAVTIPDLVTIGVTASKTLPEVMCQVQAKLQLQFARWKSV